MGMVRGEAIGSRTVPRSKAQVDRAGGQLRDWFMGETPVGALDEPPLDEAVKVVSDWRASFFEPLNVVTGVVARCTGTSPTFRHKRMSRIVYKLVRFPSMRLTQMEDIGGCRVVVPDRPALGAARAAILQHWSDAGVDDYLERPKGTGYRAIHIVPVASGRAIEVQLRTERQNEWADVVERTDDRLDTMLKDGKGPPDLQEYFCQAAARIAIEEEGGTVGEDQERAFADLRERVRPYFRTRNG
jgi:putative GTP pyrophosphokinase